MVWISKFSLIVVVCILVRTSFVMAMLRVVVWQRAYAQSMRFTARVVAAIARLGSAATMQPSRVLVFTLVAWPPSASQGDVLVHVSGEPIANVEIVRT